MSNQDWTPRDPAKVNPIGAFRNFLKADEMPTDLTTFRIDKLEERLTYNTGENKEEPKWCMHVSRQLKGGNWQKVDRPILLSNGLGNGDKKHKTGLAILLQGHGAKSFADWVGCIITLKKAVHKGRETNDVFRAVDSPDNAQHNRKHLSGTTEPTTELPDKNPHAETDQAAMFDEQKNLNELGYD